MFVAKVVGLWRRLETKAWVSTSDKTLKTLGRTLLSERVMYRVSAFKKKREVTG